MSKLWNTKDFQQRLFIQSSRSRSQHHSVPPAMPGSQGSQGRGLSGEMCKIFHQRSTGSSLQLVCSWVLAWVTGMDVGEKKNIYVCICKSYKVQFFAGSLFPY